MNHHCLFRLTVLPLAAALSLALPAQASDDHVPKPSAKPAAKPAAPTTRHKPEGVAPKADADAEVDPLERVRERLAERLGAAKPANAGSHVVQIAARAPAAPLPDPTRHGDTKPAAKSNDKSAKSAPSHGKAADGHDLHWAYKGDVVGPQAWGGLRPEFTLCGTGKRQSPIDIRDGIAVDLEPVQFDYRASGFRVIDNGHTVQVNLAPGNFIGVGGRRWELVQFHFHRPSEERIDGRQFDMVAHLVHKDDEGRLAVVAVLLERGSAQPIVQTIWNNLPLEKNEEFAASVVIDLNHLLPPDRRYFTYMGSLTTPPCSEGVTWIVMRQPVQLSQQQIDIFGRLYPMNARPVQQASGRLIKQSQ